MNNKGFTLIEVLGAVLLISVVMIVISSQISSSLAVSKEKSYSLMKKNLISVSYDYIQECNQGLITCDFSFEDNNTFSAVVLKNSGYFSDLESPMDGKYLGDCLIFHAKKENGVTIVDLEDTCY